MKTVFAVSFGIVPLTVTDQQWMVLLIKHKGSGHWGFPKGKAEPNESSLETARRELFEETGLEVDQILKDEPYLEHYSFNRQGVTINKKVAYYPCTVKGGVVLQMDEVEDALWLPLSSAQYKATFPQLRAICTRLERFLRNIPKT